MSVQAPAAGDPTNSTPPISDLPKRTLVIVAPLETGDARWRAKRKSWSEKDQSEATAKNT